jgi:hypothetical protein
MHEFTPRELADIPKCKKELSIIPIVFEIFISFHNTTWRSKKNEVVKKHRVFTFWIKLFLLFQRHVECKNGQTTKHIDQCFLLVIIKSLTEYSFK